MKLFNSKEDSLYLTRMQWTKVFTAFSIMIIALYIVAMVASLLGSKYFILNYQNSQMDRIQEWLVNYNLYPLVMDLFMTLEFTIVISFVLKKIPKIWYVLAFYTIPMILYYIMHLIFGEFPDIIRATYPFLFYLIIPIIQQCIDNRKDVYRPKFSWKKYGFCIVRLLIATAITFVLQIMIYVIKDGTFTLENKVMNLSAHFIYTLEYDIALSVILYTILLLYREKGDSKLWATSQDHGGSSQTSTKQSQKSLRKNLTKTQKRKIRLLYLRVYLTQICAFLLLMVLPFLLGKVLEFLVMYLAFAIARYLLGFKYSLHYKKESMCITVGVIVFGILSLAVPFFYVTLVLAITLGVSLAILLHLSYKYKGMFLFAQVAKPDKFALLYTFFDGNLEYRHVKQMCIYKGLNQEETKLICEYTEGNKISYIAWKNNYSVRMTIYKLDEAIAKLTK